MAIGTVVSRDERSLEETLQLLAGDFLESAKIEQRNENTTPWTAETEKRASVLADHLRLMEATAAVRRRIAAREESREALAERASAAEKKAQELQRKLAELESREEGKDALLKNVPPNNLEAERALLGCVLMDADGAVLSDLVADGLAPGDFYREAHAIVYESMLTLRENAIPVDAVSVVSNLRHQGKDILAGGPGVVASLATSVPTVKNARYYARLVVETSRLRKALTALARGTRAIFEERAPAADILAAIEREVLLVTWGTQAMRGPGVSHVSETVGKIRARIHDKREQEKNASPVPGPALVGQAPAVPSAVGVRMVAHACEGDGEAACYFPECQKDGCQPDKHACVGAGCHQAGCPESKS